MEHMGNIIVIAIIINTNLVIVWGPHRSCIIVTIVVIVLSIIVIIVIIVIIITVITVMFVLHMHIYIYKYQINLQVSNLDNWFIFVGFLRSTK